MKINFLKIIKNLFRIFSIFKKSFPIKVQSGVFGGKKIKNFLWTITNTSLDYYKRFPLGLDPNTPWYTE
jgi:hypothetical protein